jgi:hypothetical protein
MARSGVPAHRRCAGGGYRQRPAGAWAAAADPSRARLLAVAVAYDPPAWLQLAIWLPVTLFAALGLLQPTKGTIVALQWQTGMHGFEEAKRQREGSVDSQAGLAVRAVTVRR